MLAAIKGSVVPVNVTVVDGYPGTEIASVPVKVSVRSQHVLVDHDVCGQLAVDSSVTAVDCRRKGIQFVGRTDFIVAVAVGILQGYLATRVYGNGEISRRCRTRRQS